MSAPAVIAGAIVVGGAAVTLWLNLPGHLSYDSIVQLAQGRAGVYNLEHPPVMAWLLGLADRVIPGAALFVVFDAVLIAAGCAAFAGMAHRSAWLAVLAAAALAASPQLIIYPAIVWTDVLFAGAGVAAFACLAWAARCWTAPPARYALLGAGALLIALAALARQNGALLAPFAAIAVAFMTPAQAGRPPLRGRAAHGFAFLALSGAIAVAGAAGLGARDDGRYTNADHWQELQTYDLVAALARQPSLDLPALGPSLAHLLRTEGVADYDPAGTDRLGPVLSQMDDTADAQAQISDEWRSLILRHPLLYLRVRMSAFDWLVLDPKLDRCLPVYVGVDGPQPEMGDLGLARRGDARDNALEAYALSPPVKLFFAHAAFGALSLLILVKLLLRRRPEDLAVASMLAGALAFTLSFAVISIGCDYRYLYFLDLAAMAGGLYLAATVEIRQPRRAGFRPGDALAE
ncbi:MAG: hypothetical protein ACHP7N_05530 [Caulobacterales bacterium]